MKWLLIKNVKKGNTISLVNQKITMKRAIFFISCLYGTTLFGQDQTIKNLQTEAGKAIKKDPNDTIPKTWKMGATFSLNLSQGSLNNWAAGGEKFSLAVNT